MTDEERPREPAPRPPPTDDEDDRPEPDELPATREDKPDQHIVAPPKPVAVDLGIPSPTPEEETILGEIINGWNATATVNDNMHSLDSALERAVARGLRDLDGYRVGVALATRLRPIDANFTIRETTMGGHVIAVLAHAVEKVAEARVVIAHRQDGLPLLQVGLDPATGRLATYHTEWVQKRVEGSEEKELVGYTTTSYITPTSFAARRFVDQRGSAWFETISDGTAIRGQEGEIADSISALHKITPSDRKALMTYLRNLPLAGEVATTLSLEVFDPDGNRRVRIRPVFARKLAGAEDTAAKLAEWYRPRPRELAERILADGLPFFADGRRRLIMLWVVGAPVLKALDPSRLAVNLDAEGESYGGKTHTIRAAIATAWGLNGGSREFFGAENVRTHFTWTDVAASTNLPILIDEARLSREDRERARTTASGGTAGRGRGNLTTKHYTPEAVFAFARNPITEPVDSTAAEIHGDRRRRIHLEFDETDIAYTREHAVAFERFAATLIDGPVDPDGGGVVLWRLRTMSDEDFTRLVELARDRTLHPDDREAAIAVGAFLLGVAAPALPGEEEEDPAAALIYDAIRRDAGRAFSADIDDPLTHMIRPVGPDGEARPESWIDIAFVFVTKSWLSAYAAERRRAGSSSPYNSLASLRGLAPLTGQPRDAIYPRGRGAGHRRRVPKNGQVANVAIVGVPPDTNTDRPPPPKPLAEGETNYGGL